ncbi:MAG: helix-turn-helix domain-containing protein [Candidatus Bathyarchaeia archaeon]
MRLSPDIRGAFRKLAKTNITVTATAQMFSTTRQTVYRWLRRAKHRGKETFKDKKSSQGTIKTAIKRSLNAGNSLGLKRLTGFGR